MKIQRRSNEQAIRILVLSKESHFVDQFYRIASEDPALFISGHSGRGDEVTSIAHQRRSGIIVVDFRVTDRLTALIEKLREALPDKVIIVAIPLTDVEKARQALLAGANGFVNLPLEPEEAVKIIKQTYNVEKKRLQKLMSGSNQTYDQKGQVLVVFSTKGGTGATTLAVNIAVSLQVYEQQHVLLVEGSSLPGDLRTFLNLKPNQTLDSLVRKHQSDNLSAILGAVQLHASKLQVLLNTEDFDESVAFTQELLQMLDTLRGEFDTIVIDAGHLADPHSGSLLEYADTLLLVAEPTLPSLHRTTQFLLAATRNRFNISKIHPILNKVGVRGGIDVDSIVNTLQMDFAGMINYNDKLANSATNNGVPFVLSEQNSKITKQVRYIAHLVATNNKQPPSSPTNVEVNHLFNRLNLLFSHKETIPITGMV